MPREKHAPSVASCNSQWILSPALTRFFSYTLHSCVTYSVSNPAYPLYPFSSSLPIISSLIGVWAGGGAGAAVPPESGKIYFFRAIEQFFGQRPKMGKKHFKNYKWKIWKIFHRLQQNEVSEIRALWGEAFWLEVQMLTVGVCCLVWDRSSCIVGKNKERKPLETAERFRYLSSFPPIPRVLCFCFGHVTAGVT